MKIKVFLAEFLLTTTALVGAASGQAPSDEISPDLKSERFLQEEDVPVVGIGSIKPINDGSSSRSYIAADLIDALQRDDQYSGEQYT